MSKAMLEFLRTETRNLEQAGLLRKELVLESPQGATITVGRRELLNFCSSDYLGLSNHPEVKRAAKAAVDAFGAGTASPRAVTGTLAMHVELERAVSRFLGTEDTLVFPSGYHAATGLFESLVSEKDHVFCDALAQPAIADGVRLCRGRVYSFRHRDMHDLEERLRRSRSARFRLIVTDGVFPLDGSTAHLAAICNLAEQYDAMVVVEDGQGVGVLGPQGRGTADLLGVSSQVHLTCGGFSHALGGGAGGFASGRKEIVAWLRQKSRPYLTSAALPPGSAAAALKAVELAGLHPELRVALIEQVRLLRSALQDAGFRLLGSDHPAVPVVLGDAVATQRMADLLFKKGIFAMGFCHPVVPEGSARIRLQVSVKHSEKALRGAAAAFAEAARELGLQTGRAPTS